MPLPIEWGYLAGSKPAIDATLEHCMYNITVSAFTIKTLIFWRVNVYLNSVSSSAMTSQSLSWSSWLLWNLLMIAIILPQWPTHVVGSLTIALHTQVCVLVTTSFSVGNSYISGLKLIIFNFTIVGNATFSIRGPCTLNYWYCVYVYNIHACIYMCVCV